MNDFTKEELILIEEFFLEQEEVPDMPYIHLYLLRKIQSMIANYCEHTPSDKQPNEFKWQLCNKCGKDYK